MRFWLFNFSNFWQNFLRKNLQVSKKVLKVLIKFYRFTNIYDQKFLDNETTSLWILFEICTEEPFASYTSILLKCIVGYSNENESFTGGLFSNYEPSNMLFHFFLYLICSVFHETFVKKFMKKLSFFSSNSKNTFQENSILLKIKMSNFVILKWRPVLWI